MMISWRGHFPSQAVMMTRDEDFRVLKELGSGYMRDSLYPEEKVVRSYGKNDIPIGMRKGTGGVYYLDFKDRTHCVVIGRTGSGKSFLLRGMADRIMARPDHALIFLIDPKNEFGSSTKPVQEKFRSLLLPDEEPQGMRVVSLRPTFFRAVGRLPHKNKWFSVSPHRMTEADFFSLLRAEKMTPTQQAIMTVLLPKILKHIAKIKGFAWKDIDDIIDGLKGISNQQKQSMRFKFRPLHKSNFYVPEYCYDVIEMMRRGMVPAVNMEQYEDFSESGFRYPHVIIRVLLRAVVNARRNNLLPKSFLFMDEFSTFNDIEDFVRAVKVYGRYGVHLFFGTQRLSDLDVKVGGGKRESVVSQMRYIFVPAGIEQDVMVECLEMSGMIRNVWRKQAEANAVLKRMSRFEWLVIDRVEQRMDIIKPLAPLSHHKES